MKAIINFYQHTSIKWSKKQTTKLLLVILICLLSNNLVLSQNSLYSVSFKANQGNYKNNYAAYYYTIKKEGNKYQLINKNGQDVFQKSYDTIIKNQYFIKTSNKKTIAIYRTENLEKVEIPNLKQAYFKQNGLEVLTNNGAQYYDNSISKIDTFPTIELFKCGTVYSQQYTLKQNEKTKKHRIEISEGEFGSFREEKILEFIETPSNIENICFLNGEKYIYKSINNSYNPYPNLIKIVKNGKSGIYFYATNKAIYPIKKKKKKTYLYDIDTITGDTIIVIVPETPEPISFTKKGSIKLQQILAIEYNQIQQNKFNGLIYLYKDKKIGIYPNHINTDFDFFKEKTTSFYEISKNGNKGWIDINTFKEYYF